MTDSSHTPAAQGDINRYPIPRLLFYLYKKEFLGQLELVEPGGIKGSIFFRDGFPVHANFPFSEDVLGRILLERGLITEEAFICSLQKLALGEELQGKILMNMGAVDLNTLVDGLKIQLLRKLNRLFI